jgi:hypothetical protein
MGNEEKDIYKQLETELNKRLKQFDKELNQDRKAELKEPQRITYKKMKTTEFSDEDLKKIAENGLKDSYLAEREGLVNDAKDKINELISNKENINNSQVKTLNDIEKTYKGLKENINNEVIKRGLQRSSIAEEQLKETESDKANQVLSLIKENERKRIEIDEQIKRYESGIDNALSDFDIGYAAKLNEKIKVLKKEQDELNREIAAYNNELTEKENKEYNEQYQDYLNQKDERYYKDKASELNEAEFESENGYYGEKKKNYDTRYNLAFSFYSSLPKDIAKQLFNENKDLENYLGLYYNK